MNRKALSAAGIMLQNIIAIVDEKKRKPVFFLRFPKEIHLRFSFCFLTMSPDKTRVEEQVWSCDEGCGKLSGSRLGGCGWAGHPGAVNHSQEETRKWQSDILPSTLQPQSFTSLWHPHWVEGMPAQNFTVNLQK